LASPIPEEALRAIEAAVRRNPDGVSAPVILHALATPVPQRTLQYRLKHLVRLNRLVMDGEGRWARYRMPEKAIDPATREDADEPDIPLSEAGKVIRDHVSQAAQARKPVGYDRNWSPLVPEPAGQDRQTQSVHGRYRAGFGTGSSGPDTIGLKRS
jgi:hypothetical protein